jgi:hypothetical protein
MFARPARYSLPVVAIIALSHVTPVAAADACGAVSDALMKLAQTPNHSFTESTGAIAGGRSRTNERIVTATAAYIQAQGKWLESSLTPRQELQMQKDAMAEKKNGTCQYVRDEAIDGEPAALYATHKQDDGGQSDSQIWISRKRGLPLRQVVHLSVGGGKAGESRMTTRYVYENVRAPDGVS